MKIQTREKTEIQDKNPLSQKEQSFIENQNHCALCSTELSISVSREHQDLYLVEEAHCPKCKIKTRVKNHGVH